MHPLVIAVEAKRPPFRHHFAPRHSPSLYYIDYPASSEPGRFDRTAARAMTRMKSSDWKCDGSSKDRAHRSACLQNVHPARHGVFRGPHGRLQSKESTKQGGT